jgi:hypothetical protein
LAIPAATAALAQSPAPTAQQWRDDLAFLARTLPERHPRPFGTITRERWLAAVAALDGSIPSIPPHAIAVGFARVVALIGDAHTVAYAASVPPGFHSLPIRLYWFADGLHVIAATRSREALLGLRLTRVGATPVDSAVRVVARTFVGENAALLRTGAAQALTTIEVLHALGLSEDASGATLGFEGPSGPVQVTLPRVEDLNAAEWIRWPERTGAPTPLARSRPQSWYWHQRDDASGLHFLQPPTACSC